MRFVESRLGVESCPPTTIPKTPLRCRTVAEHHRQECHAEICNIPMHELTVLVACDSESSVAAHELIQPVLLSVLPSTGSKRRTRPHLRDRFGSMSLDIQQMLPVHQCSDRFGRARNPNPYGECHRSLLVAGRRGSGVVGYLVTDMRQRKSTQAPQDARTYVCIGIY